MRETKKARGVHDEWSREWSRSKGYLVSPGKKKKKKKKEEDRPNGRRTGYSPA